MSRSIVCVRVVVSGLRLWLRIFSRQYAEEDMHGGCILYLPTLSRMLGLSCVSKSIRVRDRDKDKDYG